MKLKARIVLAALAVSVGVEMAGAEVSIFTGPVSGGPNTKRFEGSTLTASFFSYDPAYAGGVRVAAGDVNGDGVADIITGAGTDAAGAGHVKVFDGATLLPLADFVPFGAGALGGVSVAVGNFAGSGRAGLAVGSGAGDPSLVRLFDVSGTVVGELTPYDRGFTGGVRVAAGDVDGDGIADIVTGSGPASAGSGHVKVFSGKTGEISVVLSPFFPFGEEFTAGVNVAAGDVNGDGLADIITGGDIGSGPVVRVFSGADRQLLLAFNAFDAAFRGGVSVGSADVNGDGLYDILVGQLSGGSQVKAFDGRTGNTLLSFLPYAPSFTGGVFVAGATPIPEPTMMGFALMGVGGLLLGRRRGV